MLRPRLLSESALLVFLCLSVSGPAWSGDEPAALTNFPTAKVVIGQTDFTSGACDQGGNPTDNSLCGPEGGAAGKKLFYVPDSENNRVLGFKKIPKKNGASAKFVLGQ